MNAPSFQARIQAQANSGGNLIDLVLLIILLGAGLAALVLLCQATFPGIVARARANAERMPIRSFVVGLINFLFFGLIAIAFLSRGRLAQSVGLIILTILLSFIAVGLAAMASLVGARLRPGDAGWLRPMLAGIVTLELAALVPIVGWFTVPVLACLTGYGATIIALLRRTKSAGSG